MALLRDNLARIDALGMPAFLESTDPGNNPRYERLGFTRIREYALPAGGPVVTQMWRTPR
jgi:predicted N-acetyltransferase YhbS